MLNFIYWPISAILWVWHKIFAVPFGADSGLSWVLAIIFLTFTVRAFLVRPMYNQMRSMMKMQKMQPRMQEIRDKYKNDQQKQMEETRKLQKEMGVNPLAGCIPVLVQMPVFLGLFHVLRSFNRTGTGSTQLGLTPEQNLQLPNYIFGTDDVRSFLDATIFGVPISAYMSMPEDMFHAFASWDFTRAQIVAVAMPLVLVIVLATHFNARLSVNRQEERRRTGKQQAPANDQMAMQANMMNRMMLWIMPGTILVTGAFWHLGLLFYMVSNNIWTFFQSRWIFAKIDREEEEEEAAIREAKRASAPKPGVKPNNPKKRKKRGNQAKK